MVLTGRSTILSMGMPTKTFRAVHEQLAQRLVDTDIETEAQKSNRRDILKSIEMNILGTGSWELSLSEKGGYTTTSPTVTPLMTPLQYNEASGEAPRQDTNTTATEDDMADFQINNDSLTIPSLPQNLPPVGGMLHLSSRQNATMATQCTN